jgi:F-type H+-transporting ATPase subunit delta
LNRKLSATIPGELQLTEKINPALIGGFIITIGDKQIDASVSQQLKNLRQELTQ